MIAQFYMVSVADSPRTALKRHGQAFDLRVLSQVRTLYLVQGLSPKDIEGMGLGLTREQVSQMAKNHGWAKVRGTALAKAEQSTRAHADSVVEKVAEALATESEELCFKALDVTRAGLTEGGMNGAKQAQAASSALRNLAAVSKQMREPAGSGDQPANIAFNLFFTGRADVVKAEPKPVDPLPIEIQDKQT